jgi:hypothetical protein
MLMMYWVVGSTAGAAHVKSVPAKLFDVRDLGAASPILGLEIIQGRTNYTLCVGQSQYAETVLGKYNMNERTPRASRGTRPAFFGYHLC